MAISPVPRQLLDVTHLRERRKALGISQTLLAKLVGVSVPTVYLWEKGLTKPTRKHREALEAVISDVAKGHARCPNGNRLGFDYRRLYACSRCAYRRDCAAIRKQYLQRQLRPFQRRSPPPESADPDWNLTA